MLHENLNGKNEKIPFNVSYSDTFLMVADIHTKGFTDPKKWAHAHTMAGVMDPSKLADRIKFQKRFFGLTEKIPKDDLETFLKGSSTVEAPCLDVE